MEIQTALRHGFWDYKFCVWWKFDRHVCGFYFGVTLWIAVVNLFNELRKYSFFGLNQIKKLKKKIQKLKLNRKIQKMTNSRNQRFKVSIQWKLCQNTSILMQWMDFFSLASRNQCILFSWMLYIFFICHWSSHRGCNVRICARRNLFKYQFINVHYSSHCDRHTAIVWWCCVTDVVVVVAFFSGCNENELKKTYTNRQSYAKNKNEITKCVHVMDATFN